MESTPYYSNGVLLLVTNVTVMDFGKDNSTILNCPIGSQIEILSFTMGILPKACLLSSLAVQPAQTIPTVYSVVVLLDLMWCQDFSVFHARLEPTVLKI